MHNEGGTFQGYLDRVDLPSVTTKVHLVPIVKLVRRSVDEWLNIITPSCDGFGGQHDHARTNIICTGKHQFAGVTLLWPQDGMQNERR